MCVWRSNTQEMGIVASEWVPTMHLRGEVEISSKRENVLEGN